MRRVLTQPIGPATIPDRRHLKCTKKESLKFLCNGATVALRLSSSGSPGGSTVTGTALTLATALL